MSDTGEIIKQLQQNLQSLLKQHTALKKKNIALIKQNEKLNQVISNHESSIEQLKLKVNSASAITQFTTDEEKQNLKKTLDRYIAEIDKCLTMLNAR